MEKNSICSTFLQRDKLAMKIQKNRITEFIYIVISFFVLPNLTAFAHCEVLSWLADLKGPKCPKVGSQLLPETSSAVAVVISGNGGLGSEYTRELMMNSFLAAPNRIPLIILP